MGEPVNHKLKPDEQALLVKLQARERLRRQATADDFPMADSYFAELGIPYKRGCYILEKFCRWGWWNYGVSLRTGWLEGRVREEALRNELTTL